MSKPKPHAKTQWLAPERPERPDNATRGHEQSNERHRSVCGQFEIVVIPRSAKSRSKWPFVFMLYDLTEDPSRIDGIKCSSLAAAKAFADGC